MRKTMITASMLTLVTAVDGWAQGASGILDNDRYNPALQMAHQAYMNDDPQSTATHLKELLMSPDATQAEIDNAYELYRKGVRGQEDAADWTLPTEITRMKVEVRRRKKWDRSADFYMKLGGNLSQEGALQQFQLIKYPDQVIIDSQAGIGQYEEDVWQGQPEFDARTEKTNSPVEHGLYLLNLRTATADVQGWFIITPDMNSTASPVFLSPQTNQSVAGPNPEAHFRDFTSPEFDPGTESRNLISSISRIFPDEDYRWEYLWSYYKYDPGLSSYTMGVANDAGGSVQFEPGHYVINHSYRETHRFGDLKIHRTSRIDRVFRIE